MISDATKPHIKFGRIFVFLPIFYVWAAIFKRPYCIFKIATMYLIVDEKDNICLGKNAQYIEMNKFINIHDCYLRFIHGAP